jgi:hypothetical protein
MCQMSTVMNVKVGEEKPKEMSGYKHVPGPAHGLNDIDSEEGP